MSKTPLHVRSSGCTMIVVSFLLRVLSSNFKTEKVRVAVTLPPRIWGLTAANVSFDIRHSNWTSVAFLGLR